MLAAASKIQASNSFCVSTIFFFVNFAVHLPQKQKSNASEKRVRRTVHTRCRQLYLDNHSELDTLSYNFFSQWPLLITLQNTDLSSWIIHIHMMIHVHLCVFMYDLFILERVWIRNLELFTFLRIYILQNNIYFVYDHVPKCRFCLFNTPACIWR